MAGKKKVLVLKDVGGGLRGSTSGLRFNPREAPEFAEEDRNYGRDDPEGKEQEEDEKRRSKAKRLRHLNELAHVALQGSGKRKRGEHDDQRNDEALSEMTGPVSSTGYPLDVAVGAKTGGGSVMGGPNIMTGEPLDMALFSIRKDYAATQSQAKPLRPPSLFESSIGKPKHKTQKKGLLARRFLDTVRRVFGKRLRVEGRKPWKHSTTMNAAKKIIQGGMRAINRAAGFWFPRITGTRYKATGSGQAAISKNPAVRAREIYAQNHQRFNPQELPYKPQIAYAGQGGRTTNLSRGGTQRRHQKALRKPRVSGTPLGASASQQTRMDIGASPTDPSPVGGSLDMMNKAELSLSDITELRSLMRELRRLLRSGLFKKAGFEDAEHDDERPTPNAHWKTTSSARGPTEVDPEDDPRYWGAHPIGLLVARRGHM